MTPRPVLHQVADLARQYRATPEHFVDALSTAISHARGAERAEWFTTLKEVVCRSTDGLALSALEALLAHRAITTEGLLRLFRERQAHGAWVDALARGLLAQGYQASGAYADLIARTARTDRDGALALWHQWSALDWTAAREIFGPVFVRPALSGDVEPVFHVMGRAVAHGDRDFPVRATEQIAESDARAARRLADDWRDWLVSPDVATDQRRGREAVMAMVREYSAASVVRRLDFGRRRHRALEAAERGALPSDPRPPRGR